MTERRLNRREFIQLSALSLVGAAAAIAAPKAEANPSVDQAGTTPLSRNPAKPAAYKEASILAERVKAGTLPTVEQRLPQAPLVVSGDKEIGAYGGQIRMIHKETTWFRSNYDLNSERLLHYSEQDQSTLVPNILESWQVSEDGKVWTLHLRIGMKWSDGSGLTSEDVRFWWQDYIKNAELNPGVPWQFRFGGPDMVLEVVDSYTVKFSFAGPFGNFAAHLTRWHPFSSVLLPSTYLKHFHKNYASQAALDQLIAQYGFQNWIDLFYYKIQWGMGIWEGPANNLDTPVLGPWCIGSNPETGLYFWVRNPYYWKVDQANNQLPYINSLRYDLVSNDDEVKQRLAQGKIDILGQHDVSLANYAYYQANQTNGNYVIGDYVSCMSDRFVLFPQHHIAGDTVLTNIVNHPNFVKALSLAINRTGINMTLFHGLATVGQLSVLPSSNYYKAEYGTAWASYDLAQANDLLDDMGLNLRDGQGYRLRPDAQRLIFNIEHTGERIGPIATALAEMVASFWQALGIDSSAIVVDDGTYENDLYTYQAQCVMWSADRCSDMLWPIEPQWFIPTSPGQGTASTAWSQWYVAGNRSDPNLIEPPESIKTLYGYFDQMTATTDENERVGYGQQILDALASNPLEIGLVLECPAPLLFNKFLRNLPPTGAPIGWDSYGLSTYHPETFFFDYYHQYLPVAVRR